MTTFNSSMLAFQEEASENETAVCTVLAKSAGTILGQIRYEVKFRAFAFYPAAGASFTHRVLADIDSQLVLMADDWARAKGKRPKAGKVATERCGAVKPGTVMDASQSPWLPRCGRWRGHTGQHKAMGSSETWDA